MLIYLKQCSEKDCQFIPSGRRLSPKSSVIEFLVLGIVCGQLQGKLAFGERFLCFPSSLLSHLIWSVCFCGYFISLTGAARESTEILTTFCSSPGPHQLPSAAPLATAQAMAWQDVQSHWHQPCCCCKCAF